MIGLLLMALLGVQDMHKAMNDRGQMAMGFDQEKTAHHFLLFDDGGEIAVTVRDPANLKDREAIRSHLRHIASMFAAGSFEAPMLVHDSRNVPGVDILRARKDAITYTYAETADGGRIEITTGDANALKAVHAFLIYQIEEHRTGDSKIVTKRR